MYGFFDPLMLVFLLPAMAIAFGAQALLKVRVHAMSKIPNQAGVTGAECAKKILAQNGITDVKVESVPGFLTDHYSPREKTLRLSPEIHDGKSITSLGVAAHEVGHAIQDQKAYAPLVLRQTIAPAASIGSMVGVYLIPIFLSLALAGHAWAGLFVKIGIIVFAISTVFTLITLPVEFDASARAMQQLTALRLTQGAETVSARKVLNAAALTYVAAAASSIAYLGYFIARYYLGTRR